MVDPHGKDGEFDIEQYLENLTVLNDTNDSTLTEKTPRVTKRLKIAIWNCRGLCTPNRILVV